MDTFTLTLIFIAIATLLGAYFRRTNRDRCLKDFAHHQITLREIGGKESTGMLAVENTGLELVHPPSPERRGRSFILYKAEYSRIELLIKPLALLAAEDGEDRRIALDKTLNPSTWRKLLRRLTNFFKVVRDSIIEVMELVLQQARNRTPAGKVLTGQDKYVNQMKQGLLATTGTAYEPLLEKYIGRPVVLELARGADVVEYCGILIAYTADFIELLDVDFPGTNDPGKVKVDLVVPRKVGVVRHSGE